MNNINGIYGFFEKYRFLSNFYPAPARYDELLYPSSEQAYQAAKTLDIEKRKEIQKCANAFQSKKLGYKLKIRPNWDIIKYDIMYNIVLDKFSRNKDLQIKLIETKDLYLEETNTWNDTYWGVCNNKGENKLGLILMKIRKILQQKNQYV